MGVNVTELKITLILMIFMVLNYMKLEGKLNQMVYWCPLVVNALQTFIFCPCAPTVVQQSMADTAAGKRVS